MTLAVERFSMLTISDQGHVHPEADAVAEAAASKSMMHGPVAGTAIQSSSVSTAIF
jgi:O-acetyl-ADP-ribose deacetylase (regulator of RNase III)